MPSSSELRRQIIAEAVVVCDGVSLVAIHEIKVGSPTAIFTFVTVKEVLRKFSLIAQGTPQSGLLYSIVLRGTILESIKGYTILKQLKPFVSMHLSAILQYSIIDLIATRSLAMLSKTRT